MELSVADTISESEIWLSHQYLELKEQLKDRCNGSYEYTGTPRLRKQSLDIRKGSGGKWLGRSSGEVKEASNTLLG